MEYGKKKHQQKMKKNNTLNYPHSSWKVRRNTCVFTLATPRSATSPPLPEFRQTFSSQCLLMLLLLPLYRSVWVPQLDFLKHELFPLVGHRAIVFLISLSLLAYSSALFSSALSCPPSFHHPLSHLHTMGRTFFFSSSFRFTINICHRN